MIAHSYAKVPKCLAKLRSIEGPRNNSCLLQMNNILNDSSISLHPQHKMICNASSMQIKGTNTHHTHKFSQIATKYNNTIKICTLNMLNHTQESN